MTDIQIPPWLYRVEDCPDVRTGGGRTCTYCYYEQSEIRYVMFDISGDSALICEDHLDTVIDSQRNVTIDRHTFVDIALVSRITRDPLFHAQCVECDGWVYFDRWSIRNVLENDLRNGGTRFHCSRSECHRGYRTCEECDTLTHEREGHHCPPSARCARCSTRMVAPDGPVWRRVRAAAPFTIVSPGESEGDTIADWCVNCYAGYTYECYVCEERHANNQYRWYSVFENGYAYRHGDNSGAMVAAGCVRDSDLMVCSVHDVAFVDDSDADEDGLPCCGGDDLESILNGYSYSPALVFHGEGELFLGMELEITSDNAVRTAKAAQRGFGNLVYLKDDSSIRGEGFEMVTHPMNYLWALENVKWNTLDQMRETGGYEDSSCGIHVHASRAGFSGPAHDYRWMAFFDRNESQLSTLARRRNSNYAEWGQKTPQDKKNIATKKNTHRRRGACPCGCEDSQGESTTGTRNRYQAINPTNEHTYEVRIFATSLNQQEVRAALGLVHATIEYTRTLRAHDVLKSEGLTWGAFVKWVTPRSEYADLVGEIIKYNLTGV